MQKEARSQMLGHMNVKKLLVKLSVPATVAMFINALYNFVDTLFVSWSDGEIAIGALSIAFPIQMIVIAIGLMIGIGSSSIFSRAYGRGDEDSMRRVVNTALLVTLVLSVVITTIGLFMLDDLLRFFGATASNIGYAKDYLRLILIGLTPFSLSIVLNNLTRAEGRANVAMFSLLIGAGLNIILDPFFIFDFGLGMGVTGAALATVISKTASFIFIFMMALSPKSTLKINLRKLYKVDFKMIGEISAIGMPTFVRNILAAVLVIIINNLINFYAIGDPAIYISIYGVITRMTMFALLPGLGLVQGLTPIVGFNFGAQFYRRLHEVISYATKLLVAYFFIVSVLVIIFAEYIFLMFSSGENSAYFIEYGAMALRVVALGFTLISFQVLLSSTYQAMGYAFRAFIVALSRQFFLFVPLAFLLTQWLGLNGIWWAFVTADVIAGLLSFGVYMYEMYDLKRKIV